LPHVPQPLLKIVPRDVEDGEAAGENGREISGRKQEDCAGQQVVRQIS
jgi:hypothetical protein